MIKVGDRVCLNRDKFPHFSTRPGTVETIADSLVGTIAIVRFGDLLEKVLISDLKKVDENTIITRAEFYDLKEKILERDTYDMDDTQYEIISISADLIFKRLESLLFGVGDNG